MFCSNSLFSFATINDHKLYQTLSRGNNHCSDSSNSYSTKTCSTLKSPKNLRNLFNEFNNVSSQKNKNTENIINCKYYNIEEIQNFNNLNHKDDLSLFRVNTCSLPKNIKELEYLLDKTKTDVDLIDISKSRIKKNMFPINSTNLKDCSYESCPTETSVGGTLLYISNHLFYKSRNDLCIYKSTVEKTFIEILSKKNEAVFLISDFNTDSLNMRNIRPLMNSLILFLPKGSCLILYNQ